MKQTNRWMLALTILAALCLVSWTSYGQGQNSSKKNWEYTHIVLRDKVNEELNELGSQGWELVNVNTDGAAFFKRAK